MEQQEKVKGKNSTLTSLTTQRYQHDSNFCHRLDY